MSILFRRQGPETDLEDPAKIEPGDDSRRLPEVPRFAVVVSDAATDGWHMAAVIGESANPDFYVRTVAVRWPFRIARLQSSNRSTDKPAMPDSLSPTGSTPARRLVVNWDWVPAEGSVSQLRFYVKRTARSLSGAPRSVKVRLTLKAWTKPQRRIVVAMTSNRITWNPPAPETPASPSPKST